MPQINLKDNKQKDNISDLLTIKNETDSSADLYFYGDIVSDSWEKWTTEDTYPMAVKNFLDSVKGKDLNIYVNSGGGSVFAGMAIYNMLKRHQGKKTVFVDGIAASIASVIALAGEKVIIPSNAYFMIHKPWTFAIGNADEIMKIAETLNVVEQGILNVYQENLNDGINIEEIQKMVNEETWLTGEQASFYFANIEVSPAIQAVAYSGELKFFNTPTSIKNAEEKEEFDKSLFEAKLKLLTLKGEEKQ